MLDDGFKQVHRDASSLIFSKLCQPLSPGFISAYGFENGNPRRLTHAFNYKGAPLAGFEREEDAAGSSCFHPFSTLYYK